MREPTSTSSEAAILSRVIEPEIPSLSPEAARDMLRLNFTEADKARMHELAVKNQDGALSPEETAELDNYIQVSHLLALLHSKARRSLRMKKVS